MPSASENGSAVGAVVVTDSRAVPGAPVPTPTVVPIAPR